MIKKLAPWLILSAVVVVVGISFFFWNDSRSTVSNPPVATDSATGKTFQVGLTLIATDLGSPTKIAATNTASDKRLFIVDREGIIRIINTGQTLPTPFLDIKTKVQGDGEMGLLGLAFHPKYSTNKYFYVNYVDKQRNTIVARFQTGTDANVADPASEKVLLKLAQPYPNHNGGEVEFGPDGYLYIALGDGGSGGDPENRAQNKGELLGKILRINVDKGDPYSIPTDNPFVNESGTKKEIWSLGHRNPWRFSFDRKTGEMWIADVGQGKVEEVNLEPKNSGGKNYGWRCYEGTQDFWLAGCQDKSIYVAPIFEYDHSHKRCSITGGFVYRGAENQTLTGKYLYGDYCTGEVFFATKANGQWQQSLAIDSPYKISTFGQDSTGEIYLADLSNGSIYKIEDILN